MEGAAPESDDLERDDLELGERRRTAQPFLKWAGGKSALAPRIAALFPRDATKRLYREPFLGSGAMFFYLEPERAVLSDVATDLIATFRVVARSVEPLIKRLEALRASHSDEQYYAVRDRFNHERGLADVWSGRSPFGRDVERASMLVYLNKTCFNGLFRTNAKGEFNVPVGRGAPTLVDPAKIRLAAAMLSRAKLACASFEHLRDTARPGDLIYLDPPHPASDREGTDHAEGRFGQDEHVRLAAIFRELDDRGCLLALSSSDSPLVRALYEGFDLTRLAASSAISAKASARGPTRELLVRNVQKWPVKPW